MLHHPDSCFDSIDFSLSLQSVHSTPIARIPFIHELAELIDCAKMNGLGGVPPGSTWQEHRTQDGRSYFYNSITRVTQWTKPEELMSPAEVRIPLRYSPILEDAF